MKKIAKWAGLILLGLVLLTVTGILILRAQLRRWPTIFDYGDYQIYRASHGAGYVFDPIRFEFEGQPCTVAFRYSPEGLKSAPPVLLVNGFGDRMNSWWKLIEKRRLAGLRYGNYFMVDWPLHGFSDCPQAAGPDKAAEVIHRGLETLRAEGKLPGPPAYAVASSLGVIVSSYLARNYPDLKFIWIVPPLLREPEREELFRFVSGIKTESDTAAFMKRVRTDARPIPGFVLTPLHSAIMRAVPTLAPIRFEEVREQVLSIAPERVTVVAGDKDALCPPDLLDPAFLKRFRAHYHLFKGCQHDLVHTCVGPLMPLLPN